MPNPQEIATLNVAGHRFDDWTDVLVQQRWLEDSSTFRFTAVERDNTPTTWELLQFKPQDECAVYLGGQLAVAGVITQRQTAYDANQHGVMLSGRGASWFAARSSILDKDGNYDNKKFEEIARKVCAPTGVRVTTIGKLDDTPFPRCQKEPTDTIWTFLDRIARPLGILMGSDHTGAILLIGKNNPSIITGLVEGQNILRMQCSIDIEEVRSDINVISQGAQSDNNLASSQLEAKVKGMLGRYSPLLVFSEHPAWSQADVQKRAQNEVKWADGTLITATITVQGWLREGKVLWKAGEHIHVKSPMAMLDQQLGIRTVTFTQNAQGTLTTLECVMPWMLNAASDFNLNRPGVPQDPANRPAGPQTPPATPTAAPAETIPPSRTT